MEIYKDITSAKEKEFASLLNNQSKTKIEEGKMNSSLVWSAVKAVPKKNTDEIKIDLKNINHPFSYLTVTQKKATCQKTPYVILFKTLV